MIDRQLEVREMPAKDAYHDLVLRCLIKAGWAILREQDYLSIGSVTETHKRLFIDIKVKSDRGQVVLIEVKSSQPSPVQQLMDIVGQYLVYRAALDYLEIDLPLYVAIPNGVFQDMFQHTLGHAVMRQHAIPLMIYDPIEEVILRWIPAL